MPAVRNGIAHQIPTPVGRYIRTASDAISRIKIRIVKRSWIMAKMRTTNVGNVERQFVSCCEIFDGVLTNTGLA